MIIVAFQLYYFLLVIIDRRFLTEPAKILEKFLSVMLLYAGISIIYFALTRQPFLDDSPETYVIYSFLIGMITVLWAIPNLLQEFSWYESFTKKLRIKQRN